MHIAELWRYPVKSMAGERLDSALLREDGIEGDRLVQVQDGRGRVLTARTRPLLLGHRAALGEDGLPRVDGRPWEHPEVAADVRRAAGGTARLVRDASPHRFDVLPLLVATDGAIAAFGRDGRRLRPNIVVGGVEGLAERLWEGRLLRSGEVLIGVQDLRGRCVMTTFDPDTQEQDPDVLRDIYQRFGGTLALNCRVVRGGLLRIGETLTLE